MKLCQSEKDFETLKLKLETTVLISNLDKDLVMILFYIPTTNKVSKKES